MPKKTRRPLTRERVLRAAIALADEDGIEALSMRRLAKELGVEAMSLYNHVANKDEILDGIIEAVIGEIEHPATGDDWKAALRRGAISTRDVLVRHRWASGLWMSRQGAGGRRERAPDARASFAPAQMGHADWMLGALRAGGLSSELVYHAFHVLEAYVLGYTRLQLSIPHKPEELAGMAATFLQQFPVDEYPDLAEHIREHTNPPKRRGGEGGFELGLDLLLDGLERLRDGA